MLCYVTLHVGYGTANAFTPVMCVPDLQFVSPTSTYFSNSLQDLWVRRGQGFLLVYSITSKSTFDDLKLLRDRVLRTKDTDTVPM